MLFPFTPDNSVLAHELFVSMPSGLSEDELALANRIGDELEKTSVKLYGRFDDSKVKARGSHFPLTSETRWLYECMGRCFQEANDLHWRYDLSGFKENFYYLSYDVSEHFGWHVDSGHQTPAPRKLSGVLMLSNEFEGGQFQIRHGPNDINIPSSRGSLIFFPSYLTHRVTPVTTGQRRVISMFAAGPNLR